MADESLNPALTPVERVAISASRLVNEHPALKRIQRHFLLAITRTWVRPSIARRVYIDGFDWLLSHRPDRGVVLTSNHRSFFDMYVVMLSLFDLGAEWIERIYFPVRANFFYEHPLGLVVNALVGGGAMYPPLFRERGRAALNKDALDRVTRYLSQSGTVIGMHPEGTRGKGPDPYDLLPAHPGIGQIVLQAQPVVIPLFINGLPNDIARGIRDTYRDGVRRDMPIIICGGEPLDYSEFTNKKPRAALYKRCADKMLAASAALGERERAIREACARGEISDDDPNWLVNRSSSRSH